MKKYVIYFSITVLWCGSLLAQDNDQELSATIRQQDSLFWVSYNTGDTNKMSHFFSDDVEFYHDKGGAQAGINQIMETFRKNLTGKSFRLRREAVEGSYAVFPLKKNDTIYGAILSGAHLFYIIEPGKNERVDGLAKFTHLWLLKDGTWKMTRILSYDHGPAPYQNKRKTIAVPGKVLAAYKGKYKGSQTGIAEVLVNKDTLILQIGEKPFKLFAEKENLFFDKDRDLTFEFTKEKKIIVRENGNIVEELTEVNSKK